MNTQEIKNIIENDPDWVMSPEAETCDCEVCKTPVRILPDETTVDIFVLQEKRPEWHKAYKLGSFKTIWEANAAIKAACKVTQAESSDFVNAVKLVSFDPDGLLIPYYEDASLTFHVFPKFNGPRPTPFNGLSGVVDNVDYDLTKFGETPAIVEGPFSGYGPSGKSCQPVVVVVPSESSSDLSGDSSSLSDSSDSSSFTTDSDSTSTEGSSTDSSDSSASDSSSSISTVISSVSSISSDSSDSSSSISTVISSVSSISSDDTDETSTISSVSSASIDISSSEGEEETNPEAAQEAPKETPPEQPCDVQPAVVATEETPTTVEA